MSKIVDKISLLKLLADPTRYRILESILAKPGICVNEIVSEVEVTQSAVSHQLGKLEEYRLVRSTRQGKTVCYCLDNNALTAKLVKLMELCDKINPVPRH